MIWTIILKVKGYFSVLVCFFTMILLCLSKKDSMYSPLQPFLGMSRNAPLSGERCVTSRKTAGKETRLH